MRKQDYSVFAQLIRQRREYLSEITTGKPRNEKSAYAIAQIEILAIEFAQNASVKKDDFLAACGIKL